MFYFRLKVLFEISTLAIIHKYINIIILKYYIIPFNKLFIILYSFINFLILLINIFHEFFKIIEALDMKSFTSHLFFMITI